RRPNDPIFVQGTTGAPVDPRRAILTHDPVSRGKLMFKIVTLSGLSAVLALTPGAALAQQGTSSSWGTVGRGPGIPTSAPTDKDRSWNHAHQAQYQAEDGAEWLRQQAKGGPISGVPLRRAFPGLFERSPLNGLPAAVSHRGHKIA